MQNVSAAFLAAMENTPYIAKMTLDGTDIVQGTAILHFSAQGGANSSDEGITLGGTVSGSVTITLDKDQVSYALENRKMLLELGIELNSDIEWIAAGTYKITDVTEDDGNLIVKAADALSSEFDVEYEPIEGFDFDTEDGVDSLEFLAALCARRGVEIETSDLTGIPMKASPEGYTERKIIGFISALHGGFADIDRYGVLKIRWYTETGITVDADRYYAGGMEKASFDFVVGWLRCYVEPNAETLILGDTTAAQGIYFECPWMTEERLEEIWTQVQGFSYRPVPALKFFGDPRLDPGDIITLEDLGGTVHAVPVMAIRYEYDGGIISNISAKGQAKTGFYEGPVTRETKRLYSQIIKRQNAIELTIKELDGDKIISLINLSDSEAYIKAPKIKLEGIVTANSNFRVLEDGSIKTIKADISGKVTATEGEIGGCKIVGGKLQVSAANITGTITASKVVVKNTSGATLLSAGDNAVVIAGWKADSNSLYSGDSFSSAECFICTGSSASMSIGGSDKISGWMIKAGSNFGVTNEGKAYLSDAYVSGTVTSNNVNITGGSIKIPLKGVGNAYAVMNYSGVGCSDLDIDAESGSEIFVTHNAINYVSGALGVGDSLIQISDTQLSNAIYKLLKGTWYVGSFGSTVQVTSDRNAKYEIQPQPEIYSRLFDLLCPVSYKYKDGMSGRIHTGFIAQDVEDVVVSLGLDTTDFAAVCYDLDEQGNKVNYGIRYEEIVSLNTYEIQKLKQRMQVLESHLSA